jgi:hypothetical protein
LSKEPFFLHQLKFELVAGQFFIMLLFATPWGAILVVFVQR